MGAALTRILRVEDDGRVVRVRSAAAPRLSQMERLSWELIELCREIEERSIPPCVVVFDGGVEGFFAGASESVAELDSVVEMWSRTVDAVGRLGPPTLAALRSDVLGPAWSLALACDLRYATRGARVGFTEARQGRLPHAGGAQRLARTAGIATALRLLLTGEVLVAAEAKNLRLIHGVADDREFSQVVEAAIEQLRRAAPLALAYTKEAARNGSALALEQGLRLEADLAALLLTTQDRAEGVSAFLGRRVPQFGGQ